MVTRPNSAPDTVPRWSSVVVRAVAVAAIAVFVPIGSVVWAGELLIETNPDPEAEALAIEAHQTVIDHCAEVEGSDDTLAAQSVNQVSAVWARVSKHIEESDKEYLQYWRGVLEQCLNQDDRALEHLTAFVEGQQGKDLWASLVQDAEVRIRRLEKQSGTSGPAADPRKVVGITVGAALTGGAIGSAVAAGQKWQQALDHADVLYRSKLDGGAREASIAEGNALARTSRVTTGLSIGFGLGAAAAFVIAATSDSTKAVAAVGPPILLAGPTGAVAVVGGRW